MDDPTSRQVVLQADTAVLVDAYGVPRADACAGTRSPRPARPGDPGVHGARWTDFNPETIVVVNQTTVVIEIFVLVDVNTGEEFVRPAGSDGAADTFSEASIWRIDVDATVGRDGLLQHDTRHLERRVHDRRRRNHRRNRHGHVDLRRRLLRVERRGAVHRLEPGNVHGQPERPGDSPPSSGASSPSSPTYSEFAIGCITGTSPAPCASRTSTTTSSRGSRPRSPPSTAPGRRRRRAGPTRATASPVMSP